MRSKNNVVLPLVVILLLVSLVVSVFAVRISQDLRQQASGPTYIGPALSPTPTPIAIKDPGYVGPPATSPPEGCYYEQVECFQAPCDPILICPSPTPTPRPTTSPTPPPNPVNCKYEYPECFQAPCDPVLICIDPEQEPVLFETAYARLSAADMTIKSPYGLFGENFQNIRVQSDPGRNEYTTLEVQWDEASRPLRMYLYFSSDGTDWWLLGLRTYDGSTRGEWYYYVEEPDQDLFKTPLGQPFTASSITLTSVDTAYAQGLGTGQLTFKNLSVQPFFGGTNATPTPTPTVVPCNNLRADFNNDCKVDLFDYSILASEFYQTLSTYRADITGDNRVDLFDFAILNSEFSLL